MKKIKVNREYEIDSSISTDTVKVSVYFGGMEVDYCILSNKEGHLITRFSGFIEILFNLSDTYDSYIKFFQENDINLGEDITNLLWTPKEQERFYYIDYGDNTISFDYYEEKKHYILYNNYMIFPTIEIAKKSRNLSTLDRLQLLYQYTHNLLFEPDWEDMNQDKYYLWYDISEDIVQTCWAFTYQQPSVYWEYIEDLSNFKELFKNEIINLMGGEE